MLGSQNNKNILVLAAHPDDETLGCGGAMARLSSQGCRIHLMTFTDGVSAREEKDSKNRNDRLGEISKVLGIKSFSDGDFPDNKMDSVPFLDLCKHIESSCPFDPDLILTHHAGCLNVDHELVYRATLTAFRPQSGKKQTILSYFVPSSTDYNPKANFNGNIYVSLEQKDVARKMEALSLYDEEMRAYPHTRSYDNVLNLMRTWGCEVGLEYAEKFELVRGIV